MVESKSDIAYNLLKGRNGNEAIRKDADKCIELAWLFFLEYHNTTSAYARLNGKTRKSSNNITRCYSAWRDADFFDITEKRHIKKITKKESFVSSKTAWITKRRLNLDFLNYDRKIKSPFTPEELSVLNFIYGSQELRVSIAKECFDQNISDAIIRWHIKNNYLSFSKINKQHFFTKKELNDMLRINKSKPLKWRLGFKARYTTAKTKEDDIIATKLLDFENVSNEIYYTLYESLRIYFSELIKEIDRKIISLL